MTSAFAAGDWGSPNKWAFGVPNAVLARTIPQKLETDMYQRKVDVGGLTTYRMYSKI